MWFGTPKVTDERGRRVRAADRLRQTPEWGPLAEYDLELGRVTKRMRRKHLIAMLTIMPVAALLLYCSRSRLNSLHPDAFLITTYTTIFTIAVLGGLVVHWHWLKIGRQTSARLLALQGTCPSCESSLLGIAHNTDGLGICPKCSSTWQVSSPAECPQCEYDLRGVPADRDGVTICPECSATWTPQATKPEPSPR